MTKLASRKIPSTPSLSQNQALPIISADFQMRFFLTSLVSYHLQTPGMVYHNARNINTRDYFSLSLTCRSLNNAATTMLYQTYIHNYYHVSSTKFISTLIAKPAPAKLVKEVEEVGSDIGTWHKNCKVARRYRNSYSVESMRSILTNLEIPKPMPTTLSSTMIMIFITIWNQHLSCFSHQPFRDSHLNSTPGLKGSKWLDGLFALREPHAALLPLLYSAQSIGYGKMHAFNTLSTISQNSGYP